MVVVTFSIAVVFINPCNTNSGRFIAIIAVVSTIIVAGTVSVAGVGVAIIINQPNSSSVRFNDITVIDTVTVVVVVVANSVVIFNPRNINSGRFIVIAVVVVHLHNVHIAILVVIVVLVVVAAFIGTILQMLFWLLLLLPLLY